MTVCSYLINHLAGTRQSSDYVGSITTTPGERRFLSTLINHAILDQRWQDKELMPWVHVPCATLRKIGGWATVKRLEDRGLLRACDWYQRPTEHGQTGETRKAQLKPWVLVNYIQAGLSSATQTRYNVVTGRQTKVRFDPAEGGDKLGRCPFNKKVLKEGLREYSRMALAAPTTENKARELQALRAAHTMTIHARHEYGDIYSYVPRYVTISTGRRSEVGGGAQGLPRNLKVCLNVEGITNYDLEAAQAFGMLKLTKVLNSWAGHARSEKPIRPYWLQRWLDTSKDRKHEISKQLGVTYKELKKYFYAVVMGAGETYLEKEIQDNEVRGRVGRFLDPLRGYVKEIKDRLVRLLRARAEARFVRNAGTGLPAWARRVINVSACGSGVYVTNAAKQTVRVMDARDRWIEDDRGKWHAGRVLAHVLQGLEADFVDRLVEGLQAEKVEVASLQYDGLVVRGQVPKSALGRAVATSAIGNLAKLDSGPFKADTDEIVQPAAVCIMIDLMRMVGDLARVQVQAPPTHTTPIRLIRPIPAVRHGRPVMVMRI